jgi:hypothetical protein
MEGSVTMASSRKRFTTTIDGDLLRRLKVEALDLEVDANDLLEAWLRLSDPDKLSATLAAAVPSLPADQVLRIVSAIMEAQVREAKGRDAG